MAESNANIRELDLDLIKIAEDIQPREKLDKKPLQALTQLLGLNLAKPQNSAK